MAGNAISDLDGLNSKETPSHNRIPSSGECMKPSSPHSRLRLSKSLLLKTLVGTLHDQTKKICGFAFSRPYLAFERRNPDPKRFYWIMLVSGSTQRKTFVEHGNLRQYQGNLSLDVETLTKQTWRPFVICASLNRKIKKKFSKKKVKTDLP